MRSTAVALAVLATPSAAFAQAPQDDLVGSVGERVGWALSTGVDAATGRFGGADRITTLTVPVTLSAGWQGFSFTVSGGVISSWFSEPGVGERQVRLPPRFGGRVVSVPVPITVDASATGVTDTTLGARYEHLIGPAYLAAGASVKLPTASAERGLGTGETDVGVSGEIGGVGRLSPYVGAGYDFLGSPEGLPLRDSPFAYAGLDFQATERVALTGQYDYARSPTAELADSHQISGTVRWRVRERVRLDFNAGAGLSDGAPDVSGGLRLVFSSR